MARIRTIKPTHWADKELPKITLQAHLLWIALWNFSDDDGVFEGDTLLIKSQVFPRRTDIRTEQVQTWLDQLVKARFILPFTYKNEGYYLHRTFKTHQRIDKPQPSLIPKNVIDAVVERSENVLGTVPPVVVEYSKVEVKGGEGTPAAAPPPKKVIKPDILFCESEIFDKEVFAQKISDTQYSLANVDYYHETINNWSNSKDHKKKDWLSAAKNWMARDMAEGKFIKQDFKPPVNGQGNSNYKPATGANVDTQRAFDAIDRHIGGT